MHTPLILAVVAFGFTCYTLARVYSKQKQDMKTQREALEYKLIGESSKILYELNEIKAQIAVLQLNANSIPNIERMIMTPRKPEVFTVKKLPAANRNPRTEDERKAASERAKVRWANMSEEERRKLSENAKARAAARRAKMEEEKRAQEPEAPAPSLIGEQAKVS